MPRIARRLPILVAAAVLGATVLVVASAGARAINTYDSKVKISDGPPAFHGKVTSSHQVCKNKRHVAVFKKRSGADKKLGGDRTGPAGRWTVEVDILGSRVYYARVREKQQIVSANGYICKKDRSPDVIVD
jgi:hypothetical protein